MEARHRITFAALGAALLVPACVSLHARDLRDIAVPRAQCASRDDRVHCACWTKCVSEQSDCHCADEE